MNISRILNTQIRLYKKYFSNFPLVFFQQSKQFWRQPSTEAKIDIKPIQQTQQMLLNYLMQHCPKNNPLKTIEYIDKFCNQNWMMNIGPQKRKIFQKILSSNKSIKNILQIGTYCGYSALIMSQDSSNNETRILTFDNDKRVADIARKILNHSGVKNIDILKQTIQDSLSTLNENGPFDLVFMDQEQEEYVRDLQFLQNRNLIRSGSVIIADNVLYPGAPDYFAYMKHQAEQHKYKSTLYHTYDGYSDIPDGVMVSQKLF